MNFRTCTIIHRTKLWRCMTLCLRPSSYCRTFYALTLVWLFIGVWSRCLLFLTIICMFVEIYFRILRIDSSFCVFKNHRSSFLDLIQFYFIVIIILQCLYACLILGVVLLFWTFRVPIQNMIQICLEVLSWLLLFNLFYF